MKFTPNPFFIFQIGKKQILPGTLEYAIHRLVEERVKKEPYEKKLKNDETGRPAYDPNVMLKIILLAYS